MRRLLLLFVLVPTFGWVFWASCQPDDYRGTLPFRSFDAAPHEAGTPVTAADLSTRSDLGSDMGGRLDQGTADMPATDGGTGDGGTGDGGSSDGGGIDGGTSDGGIDGGTRD